MLKKIYEELVLIRKELQTIRKKSEFKETSKRFFGENFIQTSKEDKADKLMISTAQFGEFDMLLLRLQRAGTKIIINEMEAGGEICPEEEPEVSFS